MRASIPLLALLVGCPGTPSDSDSDPGSDSDSVTQEPALPTNTYSDATGAATVVVRDRDTLARSYTLSSTHPLRDGLLASGEVDFAELPDQLVLRSGSDLFDALFALALAETRSASVSQLSDGAFDGGAPVSCACFETGERWTWVWTRDTAYAVELALGLLDPTRAAESLRFKLSDHKASAGGGSPEIVQDTGTGGSWPVSTDRVVWALGAWETLKFLDGPARTAFRDQAYEALTNTLERDRAYVWDADDGLYRGEQSFLDWREQSYPTWTATSTTDIAASKALSTNLLHLRAQQIAAELATERGDPAAAARYGAWAAALAAAIDTQLWLPDQGYYATVKGGPFDPSVGPKRDLLGQSLAALFLEHPSRAADSLATYPRSAFGPPVLWPQQPLTPIYHNRATWPFVTAYELRAARDARNTAVFEADLRALLRGAALNLSNMENLEYSTGANWVDHGAYSGPVVNSRRQLWSVAGYVSMVLKGVFGLEASQTGIRAQPFLTAQLRRTLFAQTDRLRLHRLPYRGALLDVEVLLPAASPTAQGVYSVLSITLDGVEVGSSWLEASALSSGPHQVRILLGAPALGDTRSTVVSDTGDLRALWAPQAPVFTSLTEQGGQLALTWDSRGETGVVSHVYRDGERVVADLGATSWVDPVADLGSTHCYAVASEYSASGNTSHRSLGQCWWGAAYERILTVSASAMTASGGSLSASHGRMHWDQWGAPADTLTTTVVPPQAGRYLLQVVYGNGAGPVSTGVTAAVKWLRVTEAQSGALVAEGAVVLPQLGDWDTWAESTTLSATLSAGVSYRLTLSDAQNMSQLQAFASYTGGLGGGAEAFNDVNVAEVKLLGVR